MKFLPISPILTAWPRPLTRLATLFTLCLSVGILTACSSTSSVLTNLTPYKLEVVQGNVVTKEQVAALRPGMTFDNVAEILGTPLVVSVFHDNRWDYVFTIRRQGLEPQIRKLTVYFKDERLERVEGDPMPSAAEFVESISKGRR